MTVADSSTLSLGNETIYTTCAIGEFLLSHIRDCVDTVKPLGNHKHVCVCVHMLWCLCMGVYKYVEVTGQQRVSSSCALHLHF